MIMSFRWYGRGHDPIGLKHVKQIAGMQGVVSTLYGIPAGEVFPTDKLVELKEYIESYDLKLTALESINIHESIKLGLPDRDLYINNYIESLKNVKAAGLDLVIYNFMPIFDWTRSELNKEREDGSFCLSYDQELIDKVDPKDLANGILKGTNGWVLPGWEPERLADLERLFSLYENVTEEDLFNNLVYFLEKVIPVAEELGVKMAIHPDDPAWPVFGLPRLNGSLAQINKIIDAVPSPSNGVTFCTGSYGSNPDNNLVEMIKALGDKIHFAHIRNVIHHGPGKFDESAHLSSDGSIDMFEIMKAFDEINFSGPARPDHGRMVFGEVGMPGYGLYDRAMGASYLLGLWEAIKKQK